MSKLIAFARSTHADLQSKLAELDRAQAGAVGLFAVMMRNKLYRELGHASIHIYAQEALGFSRSKTYEFIRLANALDDLPKLKAGVESGEVPWTKAREVVKVATPETEQDWLELAESKSRRELEKEVAKSRSRRDRAKVNRGQGELLKPERKAPPMAAPVQTLTLRLEPMQRARFDALAEKLMKKLHCSREQVLLMALEAFAGDGEESTRVDASPYQVIVHRCESCESDSVGPDHQALSDAESKQIECDSKVLEPGKRNRQSIPPARRRAVLIRDGYRCRTKGCNSTSFLELHHLKPRSLGGDNGEENLITLCSNCHRHVHERNGQAFRPHERGSTPPERL